MKKLLAFLLLLGAALVALRFFERGGKPGGAPGGEETTSAGGESPPAGGGEPAEGGEPGAKPGEETETPPETETAPGSKPAGVQGLAIQGAMWLRLLDHDSRNTVLVVESEDSRTETVPVEGGPEGATRLVDVLIDATARIFDAQRPDAGEVTVVHAARMRFPREGEPDEASLDPVPVWERRAALEDVTGTLLSGAPFAPLTFVAPEKAELDARRDDDRELRAPGKVHISSEELEADGVGFTVAVDRGSYSFERDSTVSLVREDGTKVMLVSPGPLTIERHLEVTPPVTEIVASGGASVEFEGTTHSHLEAGTIHVRGTEIEGGRFHVERFDADDGVDWRSGEAVARGEKAALHFDAEGVLDTWRLEEEPTLRLPVRALGGLVAPDTSALEGSVRLSGAGPLTGSGGDVRTFQMPGPAVIETVTRPRGGARESEVVDATLRAGGAVSGEATADGSSSSLHARGGVEIEAPEGVLQAQALTLRVERDDAGKNVLHVETDGGARLENDVDPDRHVVLVSGERLRASRSGTQWHVDEAGDVTLSVEGPEGYRAHADRVLSFDQAAGELSAEGHVAFWGSGSFGRGERLDAMGPTHVELTGTPDDRAYFQTAEGNALALSIERDGDRLQARGAVESHFLRPGDAEREEQGLDLTCSSLDAWREETPGEGSALVRSYHVDASGAVEGRVSLGDESTQIAADSVKARRDVNGTREDGRFVPHTAELHVEVEGSISGTLALQSSQVDLQCDRLTLDRGESLEPAGGAQPVEPPRSQVEAQGEVEFEMVVLRSGREPVQLNGSGDRLVLYDIRRPGIAGAAPDASLPQPTTGTTGGVLQPLPGQRVHLAGTLPGQDTPFSMDAQSIEFTGGDRITAVDPEIDVGQGNPELPSVDRFRARADRMDATETSVRLEGSVDLGTSTAGGVPWHIVADAVTIEGAVGSAAEGPQLERLKADGHVKIQLGVTGFPLSERVVATAEADHVRGDKLTGALRLEGDPSGARASVRTAAFVTEAQWIEVDPENQILRSTGPGKMIPLGGADPDNPDWTLTFSASSTMIDDSTNSFVYAIDQPYFESRYLDGVLRGSVAVFWFDQRGWKELPQRVNQPGHGEEVLRSEALPGGTVHSQVPLARLFQLLQSHNVNGVLREAYFEGPIEVLRGDQLVAHAESMYLDCVVGNGWLKDVQLNIYGKDIGEDFEKLVVRADWVRQSQNGTLQADHARVTTSPFAQPSLVVETGDLRIVPNTGPEKESYRVYMRDNRIRFRNWGWSLPLPPIAFGTDENYKPLWPTFRLANSARFGTLLTLGFRRPLPKKLGETVHGALGGGKNETYDSNFSADVSYLSGRGGLLDLGVDFEAKDRYKLRATLGIAPDTGSDKGYVRAPESTRQNPRRWFRSDGRFDIEKGEWVDVDVSKQSDPGVQSEFWEDEFERWERDESYVQWRKARGETYLQATAKPQLDTFRSTVEELPSVGAYLGRRPLVSLGGHRLLWNSELDAAYLSRHAGDSGLQSPFSTAPPLDASNRFLDGLGDRDVLRVDAKQGLELPLDLGTAGLRATPFLDGRFTAWDEGANPNGSPTRFLANAGVRFATQIWKVDPDGSFDQIAPFVSLSGELANSTNGEPVPFDVTEAPIGGNRIDLGVRGRFGVQDDTSVLDVELRESHTSDVPAGLDPGWQPLAVFARLDATPFGAPVQLWHDGRYDLTDGSTPYALTALGVRATKDLAFEAGHRTGLDLAGDKLFNAATFSASYRWTEKWEFEGEQVFSLLRNNGLGSSVTLRRYGTDLVFELELRTREGEGTTVGISFRPRFGYSPSQIGIVGY